MYVYKVDAVTFRIRTACTPSDIIVSINMVNINLKVLISIKIDLVGTIMNK